MARPGAPNDLAASRSSISHFGSITAALATVSDQVGRAAEIVMEYLPKEHAGKALLLRNDQT